MKRTLLVSVGIAALAIGAVAIAVPYAADYYARVSVEKMFKRARDGGAAVAAYTSVETNIWDGEVVLHGVSLESGGEDKSTLRIGTFRTHFPLELNGTLSAGLVQAENLEVTSGGITYILPEARIEDFVFRSKQKVETTSVVKSFLKRIDASEIAAPEWKTIQKDQGERIVKGLEITDIEAGKAEALSYETLSLMMKAPDGTPVNATAGEGSYTEIDFAAIAAIYTDSSSEELPLEKMLGSADLRDFSITNFDGKESGTVTIASMTIENLQGRLMPDSLNSYVELNTRLAKNINADLSPEDSKLLSNMTSSIFKGFSFGKIDLKGFKLENHKDTGLIQIGNITFENFQNGVLGNFALGETSYKDTTEEGISFSIGQITLADLDVKPSLKFLEFASQADAAKEEEAIDALASRIFTVMPTFSRFAVENVNGKNAAMAGGFESFTIATSNHVQGMPLTTIVSLKGLKEAAESAQDDLLGVKAILKDIGFEQLTLDYSYGYNWNETNNTVTFTDTSLALRNAGSLSVAGGIGDVEKDAFTGTIDGDLIPALLEAPVLPLSLTYNDSGLTEKLLAYFAAQSSIDVATFRTVLKAQATEFNVMFGNALDAQSMSKVLGFIDKPETLTLALEPATEITPLELYEAYEIDPTALFSRFKVSVR